MAWFNLNRPKNAQSSPSLFDNEGRSRQCSTPIHVPDSCCLEALEERVYLSSFWQDYDDQPGWHSTVNVADGGGTHTFGLDGIWGVERWTEWYVNGDFTGDTDHSYFPTYYDPSTALSLYADAYVEANVYDGDWNWHSVYSWNFSVGEPDLVAYDVSASDTSVDPGQSVTVYWTAKNIGNGSCGSSQQGVMWSTNSTITRDGDSLREREYLGSLNAYQSTPEQHTITIPSDATPGQTYYIGIYEDYDYDISESNESNNGSSTQSNGVVAVTINAPDLVVYDVTGVDSSYDIGDTIWAFTTIMNQDAGYAASSHLHYYMGTADGSDKTYWDIEEGAIGGLNAGDSENDEINPPYPTIPDWVAPGWYRVWVLADSRSEVTESDENNNWGGSIQFYVDEANLPPTTPGDPYAVDVRPNSARVEWEASVDPNNDPITYEVIYKKDYWPFYSDPIFVTTTYINLNNLEEGTVYDLKVRATDDREGVSNWAPDDGENVILPVYIRDINGEFTAPAQSEPLEFVVHGKDQTPQSDNIFYLTNAIYSLVNQIDQVFTIDWGALADTAFWGDETISEDFIPQVGVQVAHQYDRWGLAGDMIRLFGHSWGAAVVGEIAAAATDELSALVALDSAKDIPLGYNPEEVNFSENTTYSWSFSSSWLGSSQSAATADESYIIADPTQTTSTYDNTTGQWGTWFGDDDARNSHAESVYLFTNMLNRLGALSGGVSTLFDYSAMEPRSWWNCDQYDVDDTEIPIYERRNGLFDAVIGTGLSQDGHWVPERMYYIDLSGQEDVIYEPRLMIDDVAIVEGDYGTKGAQFTITVEPASTQAISFSFGTVDGTATAGQDYWGTSGTVDIAPFQETYNVSIAVIGDTELEPDEVYYVDMNSPFNADIWDGRGVGSILNDDVAGQPFIVTFTHDPEPVEWGETLTLTAEAGDPNGWDDVDLVEFYRDSNGNGLWDDGVDEILGQDAYDGDQYYSISTVPDSSWGVGPVLVFARANDGQLWSNAADDTVTVLSNIFSSDQDLLSGVRRGRVSWGDYDGDGDLDLVLTGIGDSGPVTTIYRNDGGTMADSGNTLPGVQDPVAEWGDYDGDGDLDLLLAGYTGSERITRVYRNDGGGFIWDESIVLPGVSYGAGAWGDYDNDGDLDLVLTGYTGHDTITRLYRNDDGLFVDAVVGLPGVNVSSVEWGDYDEDGDLDLVLTGWSGAGVMSRIYRNDDGVFTDIGAGLLELDSTTVAWGDYDNDGDLDLLLAGWSDALGGISATRLYENSGGTFVDSGVSLPGIHKGTVAWGDYDNDGDLDILLAGMAEVGVGEAYIYRNTGSGFEDTWAALPGVMGASSAWGDYDNDGDLDILVTGNIGSGSIGRIYRNDLNAPNTRPTSPAGLDAQATGSSVILSWLEASDNETPTVGLTYHLRVGTGSGLGDVFNGFVGIVDDATGLRAVPAMGNVQQNTSWVLAGLTPGRYYWSVHAVDTAFVGSAWASEQWFNVLQYTSQSAGVWYNPISATPRPPAPDGGGMDGDGGTTIVGNVYWYDGTGPGTPADAAIAIIRTTEPTMACTDLVMGNSTTRDHDADAPMLGNTLSSLPNGVVGQDVLRKPHHLNEEARVVDPFASVYLPYEAR